MPLEPGFELKNATDELANGFIRPNVQGIALPATFMWSNGDTTQNIFNLAPGYYEVTITDFLGQLHIRDYEIHAVNPNFKLSWQVEPTSIQHQLYLPGGSAVQLSGIDLAPGDLVGVFYDSSYQWACAGYAVWTGSPQFMAIYGAENGENGFQTGESFRFLIRSQSAQKDYIATPNFYPAGVAFPNDSLFTPGGSSGLVSLFASASFLHSVKVFPGFNDFFSIYPILNPNPAAVFKYNPAIHLITDELGNLFWPQPGLSTMPPLQTAQVYRAVMNEPVIFSYPSEMTANTSLMLQKPTCYNTSDGYLRVNPPNADLSYTYQWSNGATTGIIQNYLPNTLYQLTLTHPSGYSQNMSVVTPGDPMHPDVSITTTNASSTQGGSAAIAINSPDWFNAQAKWSNGAGGYQLMNIEAQRYHLYLESTYACLWDTLVPVYFGTFQPEMNLQVQIDVVQPLCHDSCSGAILVNPSGGTQPYSFLWSDGSSQSSLAQLCAGNYSVTVNDVNSNQPGTPLPWNFDSTTFVHSVVVPQNTLYFNGLPVPLHAQLAVFFQDNGQWVCGGKSIWLGGDILFSVYGDDPVTPNKEGFTEGESFRWEIELDSATYVMEAEYSSSMSHQGEFYANGTSRIRSLFCIQSNPVEQSFSLHNPDSLLFDWVLTPVSVDVGDDGLIQAEALGGTPPYSFSWNTGQTQSEINQLNYGWYSLTVYDANGCAASDSVELPYNGLFLDYQTELVPVACYGDSTGSISIDSILGVSPIQINWSDGATGSSRSNLVAGMYAFTISGANGDTLTETVSVEQNPPLGVVAFVEAFDPQTLSPGRVNLETTGGQGPYHYSWSNGAIGAELDSAAYGAYQVSVSDQLQCQSLVSVFVDLSVLPDWNFDSQGDYHEIVIPETATVQLNGMGLNPYDLVGVFYDSLGSMACGGYLVWEGNTQSLFAHGNNGFSIDPNGFLEGESFEFSIWRAVENRVYPARAIFNSTCPDSDTWQLQGNSCLQALYSVSLSGQIQNSLGEYLPGGWVVAYQEQNGRYFPVAQCDVQNGIYQLEGLLPNEYLIHAIPEPHLTGWIASYYLHAIEWPMAVKVMAQGFTGGVDVFMDYNPTSEPGEYSIAGSVSLGNDPSYLPSFYESAWGMNEIEVSSDMACNIVVNLLNSEGDPVQSLLTNPAGMFRFSSLTEGQYCLRVEKPGLVSDWVCVTLPVDPPGVWIDFQLNDGQVLTADLQEISRGLSIYPNPVREHVTIQSGSDLIHWQLSTLDGKRMAQGSDFKQTHIIPMNQYPVGLYLLEVSDVKGNLIKREKLIRY